MGNIGAGLLIGIGGILFVYSGFKGLDPRTVISSILSGTPAKSLPSSLASAAANAISTVGSSVGTALTGGTPPGAAGATPAMRAFLQRAQSSFPSLRFSLAIDTHPLYVANTTTISQHKYGNAVDVFGTEADLTAFWKWCLPQVGTAPGRIGHVIYKTQVSSYNNKPVHLYTGVPHMGHVHVDMMPQYTGTPPGHPA